MPPPFCNADEDCREHAKCFSDDGSKLYCDKHFIGVVSYKVHPSRLCKTLGCNNKGGGKYSTKLVLIAGK